MKVSWLSLAFTSCLLTACVGFGGRGTPPESYADKELLESLIGKDKSEAIDIFGPPYQTLTDGTRKFLMYSSTSPAWGVVFFLYVPLGAAEADEGAIHCLCIETGSNDIITGYEVESAGLVETMWSHDLPQCWTLFWSDEERHRLRTVHLPKPAFAGDVKAAIDIARQSGDMKPLRELAERGNGEAIDALKDAEMREQAELGDAEAQFQLYYSTEGEESQKWICRAADNDNASARYRLAVLYENGIEGFEKNHVRAQMWYLLAAQSGHAWANANADRLAQLSTPIDLEEVQRMLNDWKPGQSSTGMGNRAFQ